ncbi:MAG: thiamine ABC transporter substrate-binding protein [Thiolinea sp.]
MKWDDKQFVLFDYGYFAFIYDSSKRDKPATSLKELVASDASILYQDPRTSTPGQGMMLWMKAVYGDEAAAAWKQLAQHTVTVTKGWWEALQHVSGRRCGLCAELQHFTGLSCHFRQQGQLQGRPVQ